MRAEELNTLIKDPTLINSTRLKEIKQLTEQFPYFQTAHLLLSLGAQHLDAGMYESTIKRTAITAVDRSRLYELLKKSKFVEITEQEFVNKNKEEISIQKQQEAVVEVSNQEVISEEIESEAIQAEEEVQEETLKNREEKLNEQVEAEIGAELVEALVAKELEEVDAKTSSEEMKSSKEEIIIPEKASFSDWLNIYQKKGTIQKEVQEDHSTNKEEKESVKPVTQKTKQKQRDLIDKIIELNPGAIKLNQDKKFFSPDTKAKESLLENEHLVTETLANIYASQGNIGKAIRAYEILSLKYPNKSVYFASLIEKLRNKE